VSSSAYYYNAVKWAVNNGITFGTSETTFDPDDLVTRGQAVTFLWRYKGSPAASAAAGFTDVTAEDYFFDAANWAFEAGVTVGTSATTFGPTETCVRGQSVTFLYKVCAA
jgi:hypothetical protein